MTDIFGGSRSVDALPERSPRPHGFFDLPGRDVLVKAPGQPVARVHLKEKGSGPPLLLVHGLMTSSYSFRFVIDALAQHYSVIVPDMPGAGRSDAPAGMDLSPGGRGAVLAALLDAIYCESAYVVGNSLGGWESLWFALDHPERVDRLMMLHSPGLPVPRNRALSLVSGLPGTERLFGRLVRDPESFVLRNVHYHDESLKSREEVAEYAAIFRDPAKQHLFWQILSEELHIRHLRATRDRLLHESPLMPVRLVYAREDVMVPPSLGPRYAELLGTDVLWMDDTSHFMQVDSPMQTVEIVRAFAS